MDEYVEHLRKFYCSGHSNEATPEMRVGAFEVFLGKYNTLEDVYCTIFGENSLAPLGYMFESWHDAYDSVKSNPKLPGGEFYLDALLKKILDRYILVKKAIVTRKPLFTEKEIEDYLEAQKYIFY